MRTIYLNNSFGTASPSTPTTSADPYDTWPNLATAEAAQSDDLTVWITGGEVGYYSNSGFSAASITVNIFGVNTTKYDATWPKFKDTDSTVITCVGGQQTVINGLNAELARTDGTDKQCISVSSGSPLKVNGGFAYASGNTTGENRGYNSTPPSSQAQFINTIFVDFHPSSGSAYGLRGNYELYNSISYNNRAGAQSNQATNKIINSIFGGNLGAYGDLRDSSGTIDYNAGEDADVRGANGVAVTDASSLFIDVNSWDFTRQNPTSDILFEAGIADPSSGGFSDDFAGTARVAPWDIGPQELGTAVNLGSTLVLRDSGGTLVTSSTGINVSIWAQGSAVNSAAPDYATSSASTDGSGVLEIDSDLVGSAVDEVGFIVAYKLGADLNSDQFLARRFKVVDLNGSNQSDSA